MPEIELIRDECKAAMRRMIADGVKVDSALSDPPYGLLSIIKRFGNNQAAARVQGTDGSFSRLSAGFMGKKWDGSGIENDPEMWRLVFDLLKPGGYLLAFSSPRTGHRMACAIEDAGFVLHPFIGWTYGSGLPKQKDAHAAIARIDPQAAVAWKGWAYGGQARKPALEPIYVAQRPFSERNGALNILKHGVGAVNLDACRNERGNHPANLIGDENGLEYFERYPMYVCPTCQDVGWTVEGGMYPEQVQCECMGQFDPFAGLDRTFYAAKANKSDRAGSSHPSVKPISLLRSLARHITPPGGTILDPFAGTGTMGAAAVAEGFNAILIEREYEYAETIARRFNIENGAQALLKLVGL